MALESVRNNPRTTTKIVDHLDAYYAGRATVWRHHWMKAARQAKKDGQYSLMKLRVRFARDVHHELLDCLARMKAPRGFSEVRS
jgi:hypothetical protein